MVGSRELKSTTRYLQERAVPEGGWTLTGKGLEVEAHRWPWHAIPSSEVFNNMSIALVPNPEQWRQGSSNLHGMSSLC